MLRASHTIAKMPSPLLPLAQAGPPLLPGSPLRSGFLKSVLFSGFNCWILSFVNRLIHLVFLLPLLRRDGDQRQFFGAAGFCQRCRRREIADVLTVIGIGNDLCEILAALGGGELRAQAPSPEVE